MLKSSKNPFFESKRQTKVLNQKEHKDRMQHERWWAKLRNQKVLIAKVFQPAKILELHDLPT